MIHKKGFTLVEVLVSVVILGIGILGIINLQSRALMDNQDAYLRTQAILLAYDMSDRIRANAEIWEEDIDLSDFPDNFAPTYHFCSTYDPDADAAVTLASPPATPNCTGLELAAYDAYRWKRDVEGILPDGAVLLEQVSDPNTTVNNPNETIRLTIDWGRASQHITTGKTPTYYLDVRL